MGAGGGWGEGVLEQVCVCACVWVGGAKGSRGVSARIVLASDWKRVVFLTF